MMGLVGILFLLVVAYAASSNRSRVNWRTVGIAFGLQICIGAFVIYLPFGQQVLYQVSQVVSSVISFANDGIVFVFGEIGNFSQGFIFAVHVLAVIVFFSSLIERDKIVLDFMGFFSDWDTSGAGRACS
jgi:CNT family concentrative nucleoside transporter